MILTQRGTVMVRGTAAILAAAVIGLGATTAAAQSYYAQSYYTVDPYDVQPAAWATPTYSASTPIMLQMNPYAVGYSMVSGYRPIYSGARQPAGHELIATHGGNGYVYRPIYGPSPGYRYSVGGALVVEYPHVRYPAPMYLPPEAQQVTPSTFELPVPQAAIPQELPSPAPQKNRGPREF